MAKLRVVKRLLADASHKERIKRAHESSTTAGHQHWYEDYPVTSELKEFLELLKLQMSNAMFYPSEIKRASITKPEGSVHVFYLISEFSVIVDGYPFDLGRVGFDDYSANRSGEISYGVYSRKINNTKYAVHRDQFYMMMSSDVRKAVKNACKYVVPYTHHELAVANYSSIHGKLESIFDSKTQKMNNSVRDITNNTKAILAELLHLKSLGVQFKTEPFIKASAEVVDLVLDQQEEEKRTASCLFVRFRKVGEDMYVDVLEAENVRNNSKLRGSQPTTYYADDLPEEIAGRVSVLNILEEGQYVARVGQKIDETTFWIEKD